MNKLLVILALGIDIHMKENSNYSRLRWIFKSSDRLSHHPLESKKIPSYILS